MSDEEEKESTFGLTYPYLSDYYERRRKKREAEEKARQKEEEIELGKEKEARKIAVQKSIEKIVEESGSTENALFRLFSEILVSQKEARNSIITGLNLIGKQHNRIDDLLVKLTEQTEKLVELLKLVQK